MTDLTLEQCNLLRTDQCSPNWEGTYQAKFQDTSGKTLRKKNQNTTACLPSLLPSKWHYHNTYVKPSAHDRLLQQDYWFGMFTVQNCAQENWRQIPDEDRNLNSHVEDTRNICNNESTNSSETMIDLRASEVDGCLGNLLPNSQADLNILAREIHTLQQHIEAGEGQPAEGLDHVDCLELELQTLSLTLSMPPTSTPTPTEPFGVVVHQYMDTLCATQKQAHLINSILQDIAVFNEQDTTKLEEWLTDKETAMDLTKESWAKLVKAKSRWLTRTIVMKAIYSENTWDDIKDLLRLKLCNANIHTYTSPFINIQQQKKESLVAYVHQFKTEAKCCNFSNDAATIRIFLKGLKNTQSLVARIYKKDPQTQKDTI